MQLEKGILLMALGHENYYKMARNLAISIKQVDKTANICLAHNYSGLRLDKVFDGEILIPEKAYITNGQKEFIKAKLYMYEISPFETTLFLDVDMIWLAFKPASELFDLLQNVDFTIQNTGYQELANGNPFSVWAKTEDVKQAYGFKSGKWYNFHSEFVWFKKTERNKLFFDRAIEIYENPLIEGTNFGGARLADELAFQITSVEQSFFPHVDNFVPIFWYHREKHLTNKPMYVIGRKFYAYSVGGNQQGFSITANYNNIAKYHFKKANRQNPYIWQSKRNYLPERKNI